MALVKFNQPKNSAAAYSPFNDLFDSFFKDSYVDDRALAKIPAVNISENENQFEIELAVPGFKKEDFKINLEENVLTVSSEKKEETKEEGKKVTRKEFSYASFKRSFTLPETADANHISAKYENGLLLLTVAKKEEAKVQAREIVIG